MGSSASVTEDAEAGAESRRVGALAIVVVEHSNHADGWLM